MGFLDRRNDPSQRQPGQAGRTVADRRTAQTSDSPGSYRAGSLEGLPPPVASAWSA